MKRIVVFLVILLLLTAIVSCSRPSTPVAPPSVEPPQASTENPTLAPTPTETPTPIPASISLSFSIPVLEVMWKEVKLPPLKKGWDDIIGLVPENGGNVISVYRAIGATPDLKGTVYSLWRTEDGGKTWQEVEEGAIYSLPPWYIPTHMSFVDYIDLLKTDEEIEKHEINPLTFYNVPPRLLSEDSNNSNNIFISVGYSPVESVNPPRRKPYGVYRLFLSTDGGESWKQMNFPPQFAHLDAYPETPELTLLTDRVTKLGPPIVEIKIISSKDGSITLFMISGRGSFLRATIKSPN